MKKVLIGFVTAATISGVALADSSATELDLISVATQGTLSEQSVGVVVLNAAEEAQVVGGASTDRFKGLKPIGNIRGFAKCPLAGKKVTFNP